jgi:hypothetical protein
MQHKIGLPKKGEKENSKSQMKRNKDIRDAIEWAERNLVGKSFKHSEISKKIN